MRRLTPLPPRIGRRREKISPPFAGALLPPMQARLVIRRRNPRNRRAKALPDHRQARSALRLMARPRG